MSNITGEALLEEKLFQILKTENNELLKSFIHNTMVSNREHALQFFHKAVATIPGKSRFKILENLIEDGGKDLIPLFIGAIKLEKNMLFAKSILFMYGNFQHSEALTELLELEGKLHFDLEKAYAKVAGKLKGRFRELFYIAEFKMGDRNPKRMHHAADMMVKEPHPSYVPFLNGILENGGLVLRKITCKVLVKLGDETTLDVLCTMLPHYFMDRQRTRSLGMFMLNEKTYDNPKLTDILGTIGMLGEWEEERVEQVVRQIRSGNTVPAIDLIKETLITEETLITQDIFTFLEQFFEGNIPPKSEVRKLERLFKEHYESQTALLQEAFGALGSVGHRVEQVQLLERVEEIIPSNTKDHQQFIAAFLGGYKTGASMDKLLELLTPDQEPDLASKVLNSLEHYELQEIPEQLRGVAINPEQGLIRQKALDLIGKANLLPQILDDLLSNESTIVQVDGIQAVATYKVEDGYERLIEMLTPDLPARLQEVIISALDAFPRDRTAEVVKPYMLLPNGYMIRYAALKTLFSSGGEKRIGVILSALEEYPDKNKPEMLNSLLKLAQQEPQPELFNHIFFWRDLLNEEMFERLRPTAMHILEGIQWDGVNAQGWIEMIQHILENSNVNRSSQESKTLRIMVLRARAAIERGAEPEPEQKAAPLPKKRKAHTLSDLLDKIEASNLHDRLKTYRLLNLHYKPEWFDPQDADGQRLINLLQDIFTNNPGVPELTKIALSLVAKLEVEELKTQAETHIREQEPDLLDFASKVLHLTEVPGKPIRSILILDDTALIAKTLHKFLEKSGFEVIAQTDPVQALTLLKERNFDLLILDLLMPRIDGFQFLEATRKNNMAPPNVIIITSSREAEIMHRVNQASVNGLLLKPFPIQKLLERIQDLRVA